MCAHCADNEAVITNCPTDMQESANRWYCKIKSNVLKVNTKKGRTDLLFKKLRDGSVDISY